MSMSGLWEDGALLAFLVEFCGDPRSQERDRGHPHFGAIRLILGLKSETGGTRISCAYGEHEAEWRRMESHDFSAERLFAIFYGCGLVGWLLGPERGGAGAEYAGV
jgi:hypothetical protein